MNCFWSTEFDGIPDYVYKVVYTVNNLEMHLTQTTQV